MDKTAAKNKLIIQQIYPDSIIISEVYVTESELTEVLRYLNWLRTARFGTFEAVKYKHTSEYIDVSITHRNRNTLYLLQNEE
jgi:hypothetical protein